MHKIELSMLGSADFRIQAESFVNLNKDQRKGNVDTLKGRKFKWEALSDPNVLNYEVTFKRLSDDLVVWPFKENPNGTGTAPDDCVGPLILTPGTPIDLTTTKFDWPVKYDVTATRSDNATVDALDPMIIIRPAKNSESSLLFGAICAGLGAVASALVTAWWLLR